MAALVLLPLLTGLAPVAAQDGSKPDIVLVLVDDMTEADWRSLPKTKAQLPAVFPNYFNVQPLCCPSRASILRGQYPHTHGTKHNHGPDGGWHSFQDQEADTIAVLLRDAGYRTGLIGKYLNRYPDNAGKPPGWAHWFAHLDGHDFNWRAIEGDKIHNYGDQARDYLTDVIARKSAHFIEDAPRSQPLFAYVTPSAPHLPVTPAPRHRGDCKNERLGSEDKPSFNEADVSDKPRYVQEAEPVSRRLLTRYDRDRQCSLKAVDELVTRLVVALKERDRPFYLVVASDNGFLLGEHRLSKKSAPYEESIRTTMRAVGPHFPAGNDTRLVGNIDLAPTFAAIAGAEPRDDWDGRSVLGGVNRELIGIEYFGVHGVTLAADPLGRRRPPPYAGFHTKDGIVYVEYKGGEVELYDLNDDPYQLRNQAKGKSRSDFPDHHARLDLLRDCHAAECWAAEDEPFSAGG